MNESGNGDDLLFIEYSMAPKTGVGGEIPFPQLGIFGDTVND